MDIRNIRHMSAVTGQRLENAPQTGQVALLYAGVTMGLHALVTAIDWVLSQQVNAFGGLSNLGTRSVFQAIQTMLPLVLPLITMCLDVGYLAAMLRVARRQFVSPQTLRLGFDRFWVLLRLTVIRGAIFTAIGFGCMYIGISIYLMTPLAQPLKELMIPLLQDQSLLSGGLAIDEATYNQLVSVMTPALLISGGIFLVGTAPVLFQYRMAEYVVVDKPGQGALAAMRESRRMLKGNWRSLLRLDVSLWWYYAALVAANVVCYGDRILPLLGVNLPWSEEVSYYVFYFAYLVMLFGIYWRLRNRAEVTYALVYDTFRPQEQGGGAVLGNIFQM